MGCHSAISRTNGLIVIAACFALSLHHAVDFPNGMMRASSGGARRWLALISKPAGATPCRTGDGNCRDAVCQGAVQRPSPAPQCWRSVRSLLNDRSPPDHLSGSTELADP